MFLQTEECLKKREGLDQNVLKVGWKLAYGYVVCLFEFQLLNEFLVLRERLDKKKASIDQLNNRIDSVSPSLTLSYLYTN